MDSMKTKWVDCACSDPSHSIRFSVDTTDTTEGPIHEFIIIETHLSSYHPWYKRIWLALKYIFKYDSKYGHYDCTILTESKLVELLHFFKEAVNDKRGNSSN